MKVNKINYSVSLNKKEIGIDKLIDVKIKVKQLTISIEVDKSLRIGVIFEAIEDALNFTEEIEKYGLEKMGIHDLIIRKIPTSGKVKFHYNQIY